MFFCRQCQCREDPGGFFTAAKPAASLDNKYTFVRGRKQPAHSRHCGLVYGVAAAPHSGTSTAWVSGVFILTVSVLPYLFFVLFCLVVSWAAGARWLPSFPGPKNFALRLLPIRMHLDRPYVSPGTCACDCSCDWHHRHEKANQNSCKQSSALFKLRLGMPLNVVPVDTTVRSEHTKSMWIARGCT